VPYPWERYDDDEVLGLRFRDLKLRIADSPLHAETEALRALLARRGLLFKPHFWFSTDWFSPDGVPGIAVPFYLGHPRLLRLERRMMGEAEGSHRRWRQRILRHEAGHAVDTAFGLRRRRDWQQVFGPAAARYSRDYTVAPRSKHYVLNLEHWYAQSHPTEDFAETFAVWLGPKARWRAQYAGWPALEKLEFVDSLMREIAGRRPSKHDRSVIEPLTDNNRTLREHYRRRAGSSLCGGERYDGWLLQAFAERSDERDASAERFLSELKPRLTRALLDRVETHPYAVFQVLRAVRRRARSLDLVLRASRADALRRTVRLHERILTDLLRRNEETFFL
jgi:hypothetical protein